MSKSPQSRPLLIDHPNYGKLPLNERIEIFNREVHQYEDEQAGAIQKSWEQMNALLQQRRDLISEPRRQAITQAYAQALANLNGLLAAKFGYEAELYYQSLIEALQSVLTPRRAFIWLQTHVLDLMDKDPMRTEKLKACHAQLQQLRLRFQREGIPAEEKFTQADLLLRRLASADATAFKKNKSVLLRVLADIHELVAAQKQTDDILDVAITNSKNLFQARTSYLEDHRNFSNKIFERAERGWSAIGLGFTGIGLVTAALTPVAAFGLGVAGAVYGTADLAKTVAGTITDETTVKLGEKEIRKPEMSRQEKIKRIAKKAAPVALCIAGAAIAVAAVLATGGLAGLVLGAVGAVVAAVGVGSMIHEKYKERKKLRLAVEKHKQLNQAFQPAEEAGASLDPSLIVGSKPTLASQAQRTAVNTEIQQAVDDARQEDGHNSFEEAMELLIEHPLSPEELEEIQDKSGSALQAAEASPTVLRPQMLKPQPAQAAPQGADEEESEGEGEGIKESNPPTMRGH